MSSKYRHIQTLEEILDVQPRTTWDHYRTTTEAERDEYIKWLRRQSTNLAFACLAERQRRKQRISTPDGPRYGSAS